MIVTTQPPTCPYCSRFAHLATGRDIYPESPELAHLYLWVCEPCSARVGCHAGTTKPLGTLADAATRRARMAAHVAFDPLWKTKRRGWDRTRWYAWLARELEIAPEECHIGRMCVEECERVVGLVEGTFG